MCITILNHRLWVETAAHPRALKAMQCESPWMGLLQTTTVLCQETVATAALAQHADKEYGESLAPVIVLARRPPFFLPPLL